MLTVVVRSVADPDFYVRLEPGVLIEAKRFLFIQGNVRNINKCAHYWHVSFECIGVHASKDVKYVATVIVKNHTTSTQFTICPILQVPVIKIGDDRYTLEFADLMPHGKEIP
jgi:hypothetical protein